MKQCFGGGGQASGAKTRQVPTGIQNGQERRVRKGLISLLVKAHCGRLTSRTDFAKVYFTRYYHGRVILVHLEKNMTQKF